MLEICLFKRSKINKKLPLETNTGIQSSFIFFFKEDEKKKKLKIPLIQFLNDYS